MKKLLFITILSLQLLNADIRLIVSQSCQVEQLSFYEIKSLFMLKKRSVNNQSVTILNRSDKYVYDRFLEKYMKKSPRMMKAYWVRMLFTGKKTEPRKISLETLNGLDVNKQCYMSYTKVDNIPKDWHEVSIK